MARDIYYHFKRKAKNHNEEILDHCKTVSQLGKFQTLISVFMSKISSDLQLLSPLLTATHFSLLGWLHSLLAFLFSKYPMSLASPTGWGLQGNQGFTFTASNSGLSRPSSKDALKHTSVAFLSQGGRLHNCVAKAARFCCLLGLKHGSLVQLCLR